jgi:hypothetical protein
MHPKIAVTFAALLLIGSASAGLAQGTGRGGAPSPGTGMGGAPTPGIGAGGGAPTPGTGTGGAPTPGIGTGGPAAAGTEGGTLPGMPSGNQSGTAHHAPTVGETTDADSKAEYLEAIPYKPCPANVRFPDGRQACLGLPGYSRSYRSNE